MHWKPIFLVADISKSMASKRKRLKGFTQASLKTSNKKVEEVWKTQQEERSVRRIAPFALIQYIQTKVALLLGHSQILTEIKSGSGLGTRLDKRSMVSVHNTDSDTHAVLCSVQGILH